MSLFYSSTPDVLNQTALLQRVDLGNTLFNLKSNYHLMFTDSLEREADGILRRTEALKPRLDLITDHLEVKKNH